MSSLLSLPRLKTLLDRITSARAGYLDNLASYTTAKAAFLDATVSSRASSTEVTKSSVWTSTKAGYLNREINTSPGTQLSSATSTPHPDAEPSTSIDVNTDLQGRIFGSIAAPGSTWTSIASPAGPGAVSLMVLNINQVTGSSTGCDFRITIDGTLVYQSLPRDLDAGEQCYFVVFGAYEYDKTNSQCRIMGFEYIPFNTQVLIEGRNTTNSGSCFLEVYGAGRRFA